LSHLSQLIDISWLNGIDSFLSLFECRHGSSEFFISLLLFSSDGVLLQDTGVSDTSDFVGLDVGLLVFNFELSKESSSVVGSNLKSSILLL
jgi:hypothetical protein